MNVTLDVNDKKYMESIVAQIKPAVRDNLRNFSGMYREINRIVHSMVDNKTAAEQNIVIEKFMLYILTKKTMFVPVYKPLLAMALSAGNKIGNKPVELEKLLTAGQAILDKRVDTFKSCFDIKESSYVQGSRNAAL